MTTHHNDNWIVQAAIWLRDHWIDTGLVVLPILTGLSGICVSDEFTHRVSGVESTRTGIAVAAFVSFLIFAGLNVWTFVKHRERQQQLSYVEGELRRVKGQLAVLQSQRDKWVHEYELLIDGFLRDLAYGDLGFGSRRTNTERLTMYLHNGEGCFVPIVRVSSNPRFEVRGRDNIPDTEGCLGLAWENDWHPVDLPDPVSYSERYVEEHQKLGVPADVVQNLTMKSRHYCGCTIWDRDHSKKLGVVIVESTDGSRWNDSDVQRILHNPTTLPYLERLTEWLAPRILDQRMS
jgi:hypothetical protein